MATCQECGAELSADREACTSCGSELVETNLPLEQLLAGLDVEDSVQVAVAIWRAKGCDLDRRQQDGAEYLVAVDASDSTKELVQIGSGTPATETLETLEDRRQQHNFDRAFFVTTDVAETASETVPEYERVSVLGRDRLRDLVERAGIEANLRTEFGGMAAASAAGSGTDQSAQNIADTAAGEATGAAVFYPSRFTKLLHTDWAFEDDVSILLQLQGFAFFVVVLIVSMIVFSAVLALLGVPAAGLGLLFLVDLIAVGYLTVIMWDRWTDDLAERPYLTIEEAGITYTKDDYEQEFLSWEAISEVEHATWNNNGYTYRWLVLWQPEEKEGLTGTLKSGLTTLGGPPPCEHACRLNRCAATYDDIAPVIERTGDVSVRRD